MFKREYLHSMASLHSARAMLHELQLQSQVLRFWKGKITSLYASQPLADVPHVDGDDWNVAG
jgi:hypothetical protein